MRIAVVGGGPAAGASALTLARAGADVTLFAASGRGEKPCGGAVPNHLLPTLRGFSSETLPSTAPARIVCENADRGTVSLAVDGLSIFRRNDLDRGLLEAAVGAGAALREVRVRGLEWQGGRPRVITGSGASSYDWLIAADGARGLCRRALGLRPEGDSLGIGASITGVEHPELVLSFPALGDSYAWIFPRPAGVSVGIAYSPETLSDGAAHAALDSFLERFSPRALERSRPRYRYPIPVYGPWTRRSAALALSRRVLLVGDAAALADPLTREGIRYAALSGIWAAEQLLAGAPGDYPMRLEDELDAEMSRAHRARRLFFEEPIGQWMVPMARAHPGIRRVLANLLACEQAYQGLSRRLLAAAIAPGKAV